MSNYSDSESESYDSDSSYEDEVESRLSMLESKTNSLENKITNLEKPSIFNMYNVTIILTGYLVYKYFLDIYSIFE